MSAVALVLSATVACGPWQQVGGVAVADPGRLVPRIFDAVGLYREMGLLAAGDPLPFVASVRFLATGGTDSTLAITGVSLANRALSFRRSGSVFQAQYHIELVFQRDGRIVSQDAEDQTVRVARFSETQRGDESIVFQHFAHLPPGPTQVTISIRDRQGAGFGRAEGTLLIPRFDSRPSLSSLVPVYEAKPREATTVEPEIVVNPRASMPYGTDSLRLYVEAYGADSGQTIAVWVTSQGNEPYQAWCDSVTLVSGGAVAGLVLVIPPGLLPLGKALVEASLAGGADTARAAILLSFSDQWVVANFEETISLLRYFGTEQALRRLRDAPSAQRAALWKAFWLASDPNPQTEDHEALGEYFRRLEEANLRFPETGDPGWLTDRGEVFVTLGQPDEIFDSSADLQGRGVRYVRWSYMAERLVLEFVDETGFGRFRLTTASRADFAQAVNHIRRSF